MSIVPEESGSYIYIEVACTAGETALQVLRQLGYPVQRDFPVVLGPHVKTEFGMRQAGFGPHIHIAKNPVPYGSNAEFSIRATEPSVIELSLSHCGMEVSVSVQAMWWTVHADGEHCRYESAFPYPVAVTSELRVSQ